MVLARMYVDVSISNDRSQRIALYRDDDLEEVAMNFAVRHNLGEKMRMKLHDMLLAQKTALLRRRRIVDDDEEEEDAFASSLSSAGG